MIAYRYPERLGSLTILSRPHPMVFANALAMPDGDQKRRSGHHTAFLDPQAGPRALAWYRGRGERQNLGPIRVPTLYLWGDADDTVGRPAAEGTAEFIAAPYQFEILPGVGHYAADQVPDRVNALLLGHLARHPL